MITRKRINRQQRLSTYLFELSTCWTHWQFAESSGPFIMKMQRNDYKINIITTVMTILYNTLFKDLTDQSA